MAKRGLIRDIGGVFGSNLVAVLSALLLSVVLSRSLGPEKYGTYNVILSTLLIVIGFLQFGMRPAGIYFIGSRKYNVDKTVSSILLVLFFTSVLGMVVTALALFLQEIQGLTVFILLMVMLLVPLRLLPVYTSGIFFGDDEVKKANTLRWLPLLLNLMALLVFVMIFRFFVEGAFLAMLCAYIIVSVWSVMQLKKRFHIRLKIDRQVLWPLLKMGFLFAVSFLILQLNYRLDVLILNDLKGVEEVGFYSLGVSIAEQLWQLPLAIGVILMSRTASARSKEETDAQTVFLFKLALLLGIIGALLMYVLAPWVVPLVWGEAFIPSVKLLQYLLPGILVFSIYRVLNSRLSGEGKPQIAIYVFLPTLLLNIVLNYLWIPQQGAMGAVLATNVSYILSSLAFLFISVKIMHISLARFLLPSKDDFNYFMAVFKKL